MSHRIREADVRSAWTMGIVAAALVACTACASTIAPADGEGTSPVATSSAESTQAEPPSDGGGERTHNPDALTGVDHLVALCNSGADAPPATRRTVEEWAQLDPKYVCNDELGTGTFVVSGGPDIDVPQEGITALTPGEPLPEGYQLVSDDARLLLIVGDELYTARFALEYWPHGGGKRVDVHP